MSPISEVTFDLKSCLELQDVSPCRYEAEAGANKDFEAEVRVAGSKKEDLPQGTFVTNCRVCNITCHDNCGIQNDGEKYYCWAMENKTESKASCRICQRKCFWKEHSNMPFKFVVTYKTEKKTASDIKVKLIFPL